MCKIYIQFALTSHCSCTTFILSSDYLMWPSWLLNKKLAWNISSCEFKKRYTSKEDSTSNVPGRRKWSWTWHFCVNFNETQSTWTVYMWTRQPEKDNNSRVQGGRIGIYGMVPVKTGSISTSCVCKRICHPEFKKCVKVTKKCQDLQYGLMVKCIT